MQERQLAQTGSSFDFCVLEQARTANRSELDRKDQHAIAAIEFSSAQSDGGMDILALEIDGLKRCRQSHFDIWMALVKGRQPGYQPLLRERRIGLYGQDVPTPAETDRRNHSVYVLKRARDGGQEPLAILGQLQGAMASHEKRNFQIILQDANLPAHRDLSDVELLGRNRKAHMPARGLESA